MKQKQKQALVQIGPFVREQRASQAGRRNLWCLSGPAESLSDWYRPSARGLNLWLTHLSINVTKYGLVRIGPIAMLRVLYKHCSFTHTSQRAQMLQPPFYFPSKVRMFRVIRFHPSHRLFSRLRNHSTVSQDYSSWRLGMFWCFFRAILIVYRPQMLTKTRNSFQGRLLVHLNFHLKYDWVLNCPITNCPITNYPHHISSAQTIHTRPHQLCCNFLSCINKCYYYYYYYYYYPITAF